MKILPLLVALVCVQTAFADSLGKSFDGSQNKFKADIESADKVVIRTCGLDSAEKRISHVIMEIEGSAKVAQFLKPFGLFGPLEGAASCECNGDPTFDLYHGDKRITSFALKHGLCIYWPDAWPHDMFPASRTVIDDFFLTIANKGYPVYMHQKKILVDIVSATAAVKAKRERSSK